MSWKKNQRLQFLEQSVPRRLANVGMSAGMCVLSLASTFIIPAVASPAAPVAIGATAAVAAASTALVVASTANSLDLTRKKMAGDLKLSVAKSDIAKAVEPKAHKDTQKTAAVAPTGPSAKSREDSQQDIQQAAKATPAGPSSVEPKLGDTSKKAKGPAQSLEAATLDRFKSVIAELSALPAMVDKADIHKTATATGPSDGAVARQPYASQKGAAPTSLAAFDKAVSATSGERLRQIAQGGGAPAPAAVSHDAEKSGPKTSRMK